MERSAIYRRALGPNMLMLGALGIVGGLAGYYFNIIGRSAFALFWMGIGVAGLAASYLQMRSQAFRDGESFWSPPTKRVTQAIAPALGVGALFGVAAMDAPARVLAAPTLLLVDAGWWLPPAWMLLYGCAVHAAGFFMPRGFKLFGWGFIIAGLIVWGTLSRLQSAEVSIRLAHLVMAVVFGGAHLAYGIYVTITERARGEA